MINLLNGEQEQEVYLDDTWNYPADFDEREFATMAKQTSLLDALSGFAILTLLVPGIVYWIKRSKR
jgi:hypothetical protein